MSALDLDLQPLNNEQLQPHVVIAASEPEQYSKFQNHLSENGFPCFISQDIHDILTYTNSRDGVVVFVEWGLPNTNVKQITSMLADNMGNDVIVFSNSDDVKTRAELGSCGFQHTIQAPFSEKNFLMAVQKIQSDRHATNEKVLRKIKHHERMTGQETSEVQSSGPIDIVQEGSTRNESEESQSFSGPEHDGGHDHFGGPGFDGGHALHQGEAFEAPSAITQSGPEHDGGSSHFKGEVPSELQAVSSHAPAQELSASTSEEQVEGLMNELYNYEEPEAISEPVIESPSDELSSPPDEEVLEDFRRLEAEAEDREQTQVQTSEAFEDRTWNDVEIPSLPQIGSGPQAFIEHQHQANKKILPPSTDNTLSSRDWMLMLGGIVLMLLLCSYFLYQVFVLPLLKSNGML